jgi:hypothetical protein
MAAGQLGVPVVVADRIQCFSDIPVVSSRPGPDCNRVYLDSRTIPQGDLPADEAYALLLRTLRRLAPRHRVVLLEGGSISLLTLLFADLERVDFELHADVLHIGPDVEQRSRNRVFDALERGLLEEFGRAWRHVGQRDFVTSIAGFDVLVEWCFRHGASPEEMASLPGDVIADIAEELVVRSLVYADHHATALANAGVRPLGGGGDVCCRSVRGVLARLRERVGNA